MFMGLRQLTSSVRSKTAASVHPISKAVLIKSGIYGLCCYLFTRTGLFGTLFGLGLPLAAVLPIPFAGIGFVGVVMGETVNGFSSETIFSVCTLLGFLLMRQAAKQFRFADRLSGTFAQTVFFGLILLIKTVISYFTLNLPLLEFGILFCQAVLQTVIFVFARILCGAWFTDKSFAEYRNTEQAALWVLGVLTISACGCVTLMGVNLAPTVAVLAVCAATYRFSTSGGAICGIAAAIGLMLYDTALLAPAAMLIFCGFFSGLLASYGKLIVAGSFLIVHLALVLLYAKPLQMLPFTVAVVIGVLLFTLIPAKILEKIDFPLSIASGSHTANQRADPTTAMRLTFAADMLGMLAASVEELSLVLQADARPDLEEVYASVEEGLCKRCKNRFSCYGENYDEMRRSFTDLSDYMRGNRDLSERFPIFLEQNCIRINDLMRLFTESYKRLTFVSEQQKTMHRTRELVLAQYEATSALLQDMGKALMQTAKKEPHIEQLLTERLCKEGYQPAHISCTRDTEGRFSVDLYYHRNTDNMPHIDALTAVLTGVVAACTKTVFDTPVITEAKDTVRISYFEPPQLAAEYAVYQIAASAKRKSASKVSGDSVETFRDDKGAFYLLLSDGMGHGKRAALDSMTTCTLLKNLITGGFGWRCALGLINTALTVKSAEESLATADMVCLDLIRGNAEFVKAGAASSYLAKGKTVSRIRSFTLPIGIVNGVQFDSRQMPIAIGDTILLLSDGAADGDDHWIAKQMLAGKDGDLQAFAKAICEEAVRRSKDGHDDITAAVVRIVGFEKEDNKVRSVK